MSQNINIEIKTSIKDEQFMAGSIKSVITPLYLSQFLVLNSRIVNQKGFWMTLVE